MPPLLLGVAPFESQGPQTRARVQDLITEMTGLPDGGYRLCRLRPLQVTRLVSDDGTRACCALVPSRSEALRPRIPPDPHSVCALCNALRLRYVVSRETRDAAVAALEALKLQLEEATRGPRSTFEENLVAYVRRELVPDVNTRKLALEAALEAEIIVEEHSDALFRRYASRYME
ncbi:hypothetical protein GMRT_14426 [Giardia muris]|uniref:Uncharacterized protein n=1 Tax=Giardia muris TaxID=5742 RepID=A0A4Z1SVH8_GIAMU|nr:hypothetical protein GMRT_14426 [Giardia muris]|eukprot:TNJ27588.1 hypothetical protein GMRT_14426 [Giardia muris]